MAYEIDVLNQICTTLGGSTTHVYKINALNEWCTLLGGTGGHTQNIAALNEIDTICGGSGGHTYDIRALNSIDVALGGTGGFIYNEFALVSIGSNVNQPAVITNVVVSAYTDTTITVTATVDPGSTPLTPVLHYGLTTAYGSTKNATEGEISESGTVTFALTGLSVYTTYNFKVFAGEISSENATQKTKIVAEASATLHLDGTIVDVAGSKYFVDRIGGNNVLITGYDFPATWTKGFPYKSAATIDIFGLVGVPVVSLFQNLDYGNQFFSRHIAQVVDVNGVETSEAYVADIVAYSEALTGDDLTAANTYYGVPTRTVGAKWIASGGNNAAAGTEAAPWLNEDKLASVNDNSVIYFKSKDYAGLSGVPIGRFQDGTANKPKAIGFAVLKLTNATYNVQLTVAGVTDFERFVVKPQQASTNAFNTTGATALKINSVFVDANGVLMVGDFSELTNSIFIGTFGISSSNTMTLNGSNEARLISGNIFKGSQVGSLLRMSTNIGAVTIKNNKFLTNSANIIDQAVASVLTILGNTITPVSNTNAVLNTAVEAANQILYNYFKLTTGGKYFVTITNCKTAVNLVKNNTIDNSIGIAIYAAITAANSSLKAENNLINAFTTGIATGSDISALVNAAGAITEVTIINNKLLSDRAASYHIAVGGDSSSAGNNQISAINVSRNYIKGKNAYTPAAQSTHAILIGFQINAICNHNYIWGDYYGFVIKGTLATSYASGGYSYNVIKDCNTGILVKGAQAIKITNNTIVLSENNCAWAISLNENNEIAGADDSADNCIVKNNIIVLTGTGTNYAVITANGVSNAIDYNLYYCPNGNLRFSVAGAAKTFAEWQALGYDTHSVVLTTEQYNALMNADYTLKAGSLAIGFGEDLGAGLNTGLDASTVWGGDLVIPAVVTKNQPASWDAGAFIF